MWERAVCGSPPCGRHALPHRGSPPCGRHFIGFYQDSYLPGPTPRGNTLHVPSPNIPKIGSRQLRKGRCSERNRIYHITTRTLDSAPVFLNFGDGRILVRALQRQHLDSHVETLAFVIMPDHFHWLVQLTGERSLSSCVNLVKSLATREIHANGIYRGKVWQRGFHDRAIRKEDDLIAVARYIVANPLRAGLVRSIREYPHWFAKWV